MDQKADLDFFREDEEEERPVMLWEGKKEFEFASNFLSPVDAPILFLAAEEEILTGSLGAKAGAVNARTVVTSTWWPER